MECRKKTLANGNGAEAAKDIFLTATATVRLLVERRVLKKTLLPLLVVIPFVLALFKICISVFALTQDDTALIFLLVFCIVLSSCWATLVFIRIVEEMRMTLEDLRSTGTHCSAGAGYFDQDQDVHALAMKMRQLHQEAVQNETLASIAHIAAQVAHDIRSPLAALKVVAQHLATVPEEQRILIRNAVQRIDDIANDLARKKVRDVATDAAGHTAPDGTAEPTSVQLLSAIIEPLVSEKRMQYRGRLGVEIGAALDAAAYGVFATIQPVELRRVLSNLVNNAVEAMPGDGSVTIRMAVARGIAVISVQDTGAGISAERVPQLAQRGASFGKVGGSGLGLYHAKTAVELWGGQLNIASTVGDGTTVTMHLPVADSPDWFVPEVVLQQNMTVVIVDDDASIHQIWDSRLDALQMEPQEIVVEHFSDPAQCLAWARGNPAAGQRLFLCDYEFLGSTTTGLQLIESLEIAAEAILVTSHYEEPPVRAACAQLGVRLIPKGIAGFVPIRLVAPAPKDVPAFGDAVAVCTQSVASPIVLVLDDDGGIRLAWELEKVRLGIGTLCAYASMEACMAEAPDLAQIDCAFVDKHIKGSAWTLEATIRHLQSAGVKKIVVASGESARDLADDPVCALADGICAEKIPESLADYVAASG